MEDQGILYSTKPSLRRAYFFAILYVALIAYGIRQIGFTEELRSFWLGQFILLLVCLAYAHLVRSTTSYVVTNNDVRIARGILWRHAGSASHLRITNMAARQNPLERLLFLANLYVDTAGGEVKEIIFKRITKTDAQKIIAIIRARIEEMRKSGTATVQTVMAAAGG